MAEKNKIEYNWYKILDLEFYPVAEESEKKIKNRIEEKRKYWIRNASDIIKGTDCKIYLNLYNKGVISEQMLGKNNIRKDLIKDARNTYFKPIDDFLNIIGNIPITNEIIKKIAKETKRSEKLVVERIKQAGKKTESGETRKIISVAYNNYCSYMTKKFKFLTIFRGIDQHLKILNKKNLYDFLISENLELKTLTVGKINEKRLKLLKSNDETSSKKKLYSECERMLKDAEIKREYDEYLKYLKYKKVSEILFKIKKIFNAIEITISKTQSENFVNEISEILKNEKEAKEIFTNFCDENDIFYNISKKESKTNNQNETSKNINKDNKDLDKFKILGNIACDRAMKAIDEFHLNKAQEYLEEATVYWPENSTIKILEKKINDIKNEIKPKLAEIEYYIKNNNFELVKEKYLLLKEKFPKFVDKNIEQKIIDLQNNNSKIESSNSKTTKQILKKNNNHTIRLVIFLGIIFGTSFFILKNNQKIASNSKNQKSYSDSKDLDNLDKVIQEVLNGNTTVLNNYNSSELKILRNTIYAKNHYLFKDKDLLNYFNQKSWYKGYIKDQNKINLTENEMKFIDIIKRKELK